ncbi:putative FBD-associated F-box protein [Cardamine amara subsp. amara]|uniref:FBD-associated F-box protein n=1 Tax=Cardamine amara subsp. amara TaxID=228776 RepID=A0ABD1AJK3_CARAN
MVARSEEDRISQLPDPLICQILSHLPSKETVKTSVLSTRWRSLWLWVPCLELNSQLFHDFNGFISFGNRFFDTNKVSCIQKLKLNIIDISENKVDHASYFASWIDAVVKRKIQHLHVCCYPYSYLYEMPTSFYICERLVSLELHWVAWASAEFVSLPCLKTMHLHHNMFPNEASFEKLVSCCHVLEELYISLAEEDTKVYCVRSRSLKKLTFIRYSSSQFGSVPDIFIDAPLLCSLEIIISLLKVILLNNLESIAKLDISPSFGFEEYEAASYSLRRSRIRSFLSRISRVKDMTICVDTFKVIHHYSKFELLPQFGYLSHLHVSLYAHDLKFLTAFLESCPNLKFLVLDGWEWDLFSVEKKNHINFSSVPKCLLSSLEFVDFKVPMGGVYAVEFKVVKYFLENSAVLKKLTLRLNYSSEKKDVSQELLRIPRGSAKCDVVIL